MLFFHLKKLKRKEVFHDKNILTGEEVSIFVLIKRICLWRKSTMPKIKVVKECQVVQMFFRYPKFTLYPVF